MLSDDERFAMFPWALPRANAIREREATAALLEAGTDATLAT